MSKERIIYIALIAYFIFLFIPVNLLIFFPHLAPFDIPFLNKDISVEENSDVDVRGPISVFPTKRAPEEYPTTTDELLYEGYFPGKFLGCLDEGCSQVSIEDVQSEEPTVYTLNFNESTKLYCVKDLIEGIDASTIFIDFSDYPYSFYTFEALEGLPVIQDYTDGLPVQYNFSGSDLLWISVYLNNCYDYLL